jgi:hypothetical protein
MEAIREILRRPAPGPEPLGLAFYGTSLWIASREAHRLYALDTASWVVAEEVTVPGAPFGITVRGDGLSVVVGFGEDDDDRYIYRFVRGHGFTDDRIECPDRSGAHVAFDGNTLFISQAHNMRILALDDRGAVLRTMALDRVPVGITIVDGFFYLITGEKNFRNLQLTRMDVSDETPRIEALASIPFGARGLTFDGSHFWTGDRAGNEVIAFAMPAAR